VLAIELVASFRATLVRRSCGVRAVTTRDWCRIDSVDRNANIAVIGQDRMNMRQLHGLICLLLSRRATWKVGIARLAPSPTVSLVFEYMVLIAPTAKW
jgi:Na+-translocating ferredoxin:NAD+ oxidoreductase RnfD subunit